MAEYTPTTDGILAAWRHFRLDHDLFGKANYGRGVESLDAEVLRWLSDHDRQVAAQTLRDAADLFASDPRPLLQNAANTLRARADALAPRQDAPDDIPPVPMPTWGRCGPTGRTTADAAPGVTKVAVAGRCGGKTDALVKATADECERRGLPVEIVTAPGMRVSAEQRVRVRVAFAIAESEACGSCAGPTPCAQCLADADAAINALGVTVTDGV